MNKFALEGVRVLDFTQHWAGPYATLLLTYMGAEVIKVESVKRPDPQRSFSYTLGQAFQELEKSSSFNEMNLNKMDITLDLTKPRAVGLAKELVKISDVVTENFRPGVMDRLGLSYESIREVKPDVIMLSSSAQGGTGPEREYSGYASVFASLAGLAYITGYPDGDPFPMRGRIDLMSATTSAFAILVALHHRRRTGKGQYIDLSSTESVSVLIGDVLMDYTMNGRSQSRRGNRDDIMAPHNCYRCRGENKWVSIAIATEEEWSAFCEAIGNPDWVKDDRFCDAYNRWQNQDELDKLIGEWTINHTHYEVMEKLQRVGVAAMPSFSAEELYNDPHLKERGFSTKVEHPVMGPQSVLNPPWKLSATPARINRHAPLFSEHNECVFGELLGMSDEEIKSLMDEQVIY